VSDQVRAAESILRAASGDRVRTAFTMAPLTTFRMGGPAAIYLEPESEGDLVAVGEAVVLRTGQETTQSNLEGVAYWASGLETAYLEGAFARVQRDSSPAMST